MRLFSIVLAAFGLALVAPGPARAERLIISVGADALGTARASAAGDAGFEVLAADEDVAVLSIDEAELDALTEAMHEAHGRCGGYMVHDSLADALAAPIAPADGPPVDYRLARPHVVRAVLPGIEARQLLGTIEHLSGMKNRYYRSPTGAAASEWLRDRWRGFTTRADVTVELVDHGYPQRSVVLTIPGSTRPDEVVIIGGHLDSIAPGGTSSAAPGADDDASGIATLTEVARVLLASDVRPQRTLQFMAYAAEEVGLRGSLRIASDYRRRGVNVVGVLQLDMTNYQGSDRDIWLIADHTDAGQNAFLGRLVDAYVGATWAYDACGYACSDHAAWTRHGFRASMPFEARFRDSNRAIHTRKDTLERSANNVQHAVKFAKLAAAYAI
ncbi:MAG: M20/M25/M40 family metallo-hydrolase, partial [Deltaproteobacteria bacterium]|nr:M20/M25/M40 family metallo-hydrolase [Kofleriaceae bacterium]